jgi:CheY-like chemotaxis protein
MLNQRHKILVVDDVRGITSTLSEIFESQSYETATANSGEEAVQVARSFRPDCILSDVKMGAMNGIDAAIEILGVLPQCKVLFMSGDIGDGNPLSNAIAKGFNFEILAKPVPVSELLARISQLLSSADGQTTSHSAPLHRMFPITAKKAPSVSSEGRPATATYIVCLHCGEDFECETVAPAKRTCHSVA